MHDTDYTHEHVQREDDQPIHGHGTAQTEETTATGLWAVIFIAVLLLLAVVFFSVFNGNNSENNANTPAPAGTPQQEPQVPATPSAQ